MTHIAYIYIYICLAFRACHKLLNLWKSCSICSWLYDPSGKQNGALNFLFHTGVNKLLQFKPCFSFIVFSFSFFLIQSITSYNLQSRGAGPGSAECVSLMTIFCVHYQLTAHFPTCQLSGSTLNTKTIKKSRCSLALLLFGQSLWGCVISRREM